jgi:hypothetical protein
MERQFIIQGISKRFSIAPGANLAAAATKAAATHCRTALLLGRPVVITATEGNVVRRFVIRNGVKL